LAVFALIGGVIGINETIAGQFVSGEPAAAGEHTLTLVQKLTEPFTHAPVAAIVGLLAVVVGFFAARKFYAGAKSDPLPAKLGKLSLAMQNRFYFDEIYEATVIRIHDTIATISDWIDRWLVEGLCIGLVRGGTDLTGRALRLVQTGNLQTYAFLFILGVAVVLWLMIGK